jgi:uncharacterized protein YkwD
MKPIAVLLALAVIACGPPQQVGGRPSWRAAPAAATRVPPVTFAPTSEPAHSYNEPIQAPPKTPLGDAMQAAVKAAASQLHLPTPVSDARLYRACAELAQIVPEEGVVSYSFVEFALQRNGIIEPSPHLLVVWGDVDAPTEVVDQLKPRLAEILADGATARVGIGAVKRNPDGTGAIVFALQGSGVATSPMPRSLAKAGSFAIDAVVESRFKDPEVFITHDDGTTERLVLDVGRSGAFKAAVACAKHVGRQQVEITASDAAGSTVLANFPVWCGTDPPPTLTVEPTADDGVIVDAPEAEKRLLALMNHDRTAAGLPALIWDERVAEVARAHSEEMRRTKVVSHVSPTTGSAADRVKLAKIKTAVVLENVARAYGVGEAHAGLMNSPGHRANLMSATATHVGIGAVLGDEVSGRRELFVTQVFIRIPPKVDPAAVAELVRKRITAVRSVGVNAQLVGPAQQLAEGLAAGRSRDALWGVARKQLDAVGNMYSRVGSVITAVADPEAIDGAELVGEYKPDDIGVGIAQGTHPEIGENAIWVVVLMGERLDPKPASAPPGRATR